MQTWCCVQALHVEESNCYFRLCVPLTCALLLRLLLLCRLLLPATSDTCRFQHHLWGGVLHCGSAACECAPKLQAAQSAAKVVIFPEQHALP
jgi:hypothetical protein